MDQPSAPTTTDPLRKYQRRGPDERRQALIDATLSCLAQHGVEATSIRRISEAAGVSVGLISHYYNGKEALIADVYGRLAEGLLAALQTEMDRTGGNARTRLSAFIRASFSPVNLSSDLLHVWLSFWSMTRRSAAIAAVHDRTYAAYLDVLEDLLAQTRDEQDIHLNIRLAAIGLSGLLDGLWVEWCLNPRTFEPEEGTRLCEAYLDGLLTSGLGTSD